MWTYIFIIGHVFKFSAWSWIYRPSNLPAKTEEEEQRHRDEYKAILAQAKKKEAEYNLAKQKQQQLQLQMEEQQAMSAKYFMQNVLPDWDSL